MKRMLPLFVCLLCLAVFGCSQTMIKTISPEMYRVELLEQFRSGAPSVNSKYVFAIGTLEDKTGKFMDGDQLRYSRTVTQAARDLATHFMISGGFRMVDRDPYNIQLITQEYKMSHTYIFDKEGKVQEQAGLIKRERPSTGLTGATHLITGAITTYQVSRYSGGGGMEVNAIGVNYQYVQSTVGIQLRIVDLASSEVVCSVLEIAKVEGHKVGLNAYSLVTRGGGVTVVSAEAGLATQFPADFALSEAMISGMIKLLTVPSSDFYVKKMNLLTPKPLESEGVFKK